MVIRDTPYICDNKYITRYSGKREMSGEWQQIPTEASNGNVLCIITTDAIQVISLVTIPFLLAR